MTQLSEIEQLISASTSEEQKVDILNEAAYNAR